MQASPVSSLVICCKSSCIFIAVWEHACRNICKWTKWLSLPLINQSVIVSVNYVHSDFGIIVNIKHGIFLVLGKCVCCTCIVQLWIKPLVMWLACHYFLQSWQSLGFHLPVSRVCCGFQPLTCQRSCIARVSSRCGELGVHNLLNKEVLMQLGYWPPNSRNALRQVQLIAKVRSLWIWGKELIPRRLVN